MGFLGFLWGCMVLSFKVAIGTLLWSFSIAAILFLIGVVLSLMGILKLD